MGFNKRYIEKDNLLGQYKQGGIKEVMSYLSRPDALIWSGDFAQDVSEIYYSDLPEDTVWDKIEEKLKKALGSEENLVY
jgi:hypothetical protein